MPTDRLPYLDGLRVFAFALLVPYHVGMYYVSWDWHVKSPASDWAGSLLEPFMMMASPWRLGLLFLVSGAASASLWARRGGMGSLRDRSRRLLWPLLFGMLVIVTPQTYFEVQNKAPQLLAPGGYLAFWIAYLKGSSFCPSTGCIAVPTWNHLWFLPYLWLYSVIGLVLAPWLERDAKSSGSGSGSGSGSAPRHVPAWAWWLLPVVLLAVLRIAVFPSFPIRHDLVGDLYAHLLYGSLFLFGWASRGAIAAGFWPWCERWRWPLLLGAFASWGVLVPYLTTYFGAHTDGAPTAALRNTMRVVWCCLTWWAIAAACGFAQRVFVVQRPWLRSASAAVFCLYILHQTVIVVLSQWLKPLALPWGAEALLLVVATFALCGLCYWLVKPIPGLRWVLGVQSASTSKRMPLRR